MFKLYDPKPVLHELLLMVRFSKLHHRSSTFAPKLLLSNFIIIIIIPTDDICISKGRVSDKEGEQDLLQLASSLLLGQSA